MPVCIDVLQYGYLYWRFREQETQFINHHWVNRRRQESKCKRCSKSLQTVFSFSSKSKKLRRWKKNNEAIAVQCTWCKACYHNRLSCFDDAVRNEPCNLGVHSGLIVPPSWIIKMAEKNTFKSSIRRTSSLISRRSPLARVRQQLPSSLSRPEGLVAVADGIDTDSGSLRVQHLSDGRCLPGVNAVDLRMTPSLPFVIKANPSDAARIKPLLIFLNPKSGGNQGSALLRKFQWLLNPRQVFDLTQGGPRMGLELFNRVPNLRVLACGGDGTVGWLFSVIEEMRMSPTPPVAVLPLGTGNDLARTLRWGAGYADEPISKILKNVENGEVVALDRWRVCSELLPNVTPPCDAESEDGGVHQRHVSETLPLKVFNNYFSLGADAATALEFHESREANPEKFNSRLKNKIFYAGCGGKDLLLRSWRDLCDHITLTCDDKDYTPLIRSLRPHVILFLNIPRYGSGTLPWGQPSSAGEFEPQRIDDGLIEVIGLSSTTLALLQVGGHGDRICQCRTVKMTTDKIIPMQLDGEPCRLLPSKIEIRCSHQSLVVQKYGRQTATREGGPSLFAQDGEKAQLFVFIISLDDYETISNDALALRQTAIFYGVISVDFDADLESVRMAINELNSSYKPMDEKTEPGSHEERNPKFPLSSSWVFIDSTTAASRFFRIDLRKEPVHFITDICNMEELFLIDESPPTVKTSENIVHDPICQKAEENQPGEESLNESGTGIIAEQLDGSTSSNHPEENGDATTLVEKFPEADSKTETIMPVQPPLEEAIIRADTENEGGFNGDLNFIDADKSKNADDVGPVGTLTVHVEHSLEDMSGTSFTGDDSLCDDLLSSHEKQNVSTSDSIQLSINRDSSESTVSQRTCEIELGTSDANLALKSGGFHKRTRRNKKKNHIGGEKGTNSLISDALQQRLDRAFLSASRRGVVEHIEALIEAGANILAVDERGRSGLHLATKFGCTGAVSCLLRHAPPGLLEAREYEKHQTALHKAAVYRRRNVCELLLRAGACPTSRDRNGKRAKRLALDVDDHQLAYFLQREELLFIIENGKNKINV